MVIPPQIWTLTASELFGLLETTKAGLSTEVVKVRLRDSLGTRLTPTGRRNDFLLLLQQFNNPIIFILIFASLLSAFLGDKSDMLIILGIVFFSGFLGFWQERGANRSVLKLLSMIHVTATVLRDGAELEVPIDQVVPGDIVRLKAGDNIPGDCALIESKDLFVDEATLTGETFPQEKLVSPVARDTPLAARTNTLWMGTHVMSGSALVVVARVGKDTEFGKISDRLKRRPAMTEFELGIHRFGYFLLEITLLLVLAIFAANVFLHRPVLDSFLFSLALAVGLTPQLLPVIISVNLAIGAKHMAKHHVIVKRLSSIENFGSMDVLCSDKTGTLTEGIVELKAALDAQGKESAETHLFACLTATFETAFSNPIDDALRTSNYFDMSVYQKLDEVPYDFIRRRLSVLVEKEDRILMITKGSLAQIKSCSNEKDREDPPEIKVLMDQGYRVMGVAYKDLPNTSVISKLDEENMTFMGYLAFFDPPKPDVKAVITELKKLGVSFKMITGDQRHVGMMVAAAAGMVDPSVLVGGDIQKMSPEALAGKVGCIDIFAEVEPSQKEQIILALKKTGHVVGYLGDGINDAPALHAADVGISVNTGVDVAKDAADIVLLDKNLAVLLNGIKAGRKTFANTLKYIFMATSANFGNMFSMAGASLLLPFLPLLPKQILLTNLLTDIPEMTIASDTVDSESIQKPRRWDIRFIQRFMIVFGLLSSIFDFLAFGFLYYVLHASPAQFRAGWFIESVVSAATVVLVIRTRQPLYRSRPSGKLVAATFGIVMITIGLPYTALGQLLGFEALPAYFLLGMAGIVVLYIISAEVTKYFFYKRYRD